MKERGTEWREKWGEWAQEWRITADIRSRGFAVVSLKKQRDRRWFTKISSTSILSFIASSGNWKRRHFPHSCFIYTISMTPCWSPLKFAVIHPPDAKTSSVTRFIFALTDRRSCCTFHHMNKPERYRTLLLSPAGQTRGAEIFPRAAFFSKLKNENSGVNFDKGLWSRVAALFHQKVWGEVPKCRGTSRESLLHNSSRAFCPRLLLMRAK